MVLDIFVRDKYAVSSPSSERGTSLIFLSALSNMEGLEKPQFYPILRGDYSRKTQNIGVNQSPLYFLNGQRYQCILGDKYQQDSEIKILQEDSPNILLFSYFLKS